MLFVSEERIGYGIELCQWSHNLGKRVSWVGIRASTGHVQTVCTVPS